MIRTGVFVLGLILGGLLVGQGEKRRTEAAVEHATEAVRLDQRQVCTAAMRLLIDAEKQTCDAKIASAAP